jgi:methyl-accepting chemotaxis protein
MTFIARFTNTDPDRAPMVSRTEPDADAAGSHLVWSPGVRLFRSLSFEIKAWIIAVTFLLPIAWLSHAYYKTMAANIAFSTKERVGVAFVLDAMPLLNLIQQRRLHAMLDAAGAAPMNGAIDIEARTATALANFKATELRLRSDLDTSAAMSRFLKSGEGLPSASAGVDPVFAAHTDHVQALLDLIGLATDNSNLTLDPDIDTYYLMDAAMFRLPSMMESVGHVRGFGAAMLALGQASPEQTRNLVERLAVFKSNADALEAGLAKAVAYNDTVKASVSMEAYRTSVQRLRASVEKTVLSATGPTGDAKAHVDLSTAAIEDMTSLALAATAELDRLVEARVGRMTAERNLTSTVLAIGLLAAAYLFVAFRKVLAGGLSDVMRHIDRMRDGDLTARPTVRGRDEVAHVMRRLEEMQASLQRIVSRVRQASDSLVSSSAVISTGAVDLQSRTDRSSAHLAETSDTMKQVAFTVKSNEDMVSEATRLAGANAEAARRGGDIIGRVVHTMQDINASSSRIGDIIGTIDGIAFQTNILALNAAVEAARAGEQGRGFAVVAAEVRALAQRSSSAAKEIKALITLSVGQVETGVHVVQQAGTTVGEIVGAAERVRELLADVALGTTEESIALSARAVEQVDAATKQNAALVEQTAASARALKEQATAMATEVARFQLA